MSKELSNRRQARELALQVLFQGEFVDAIDIESGLDYFKGHLEPSTETYKFAQFLCEGVHSNKTTLDETISSLSENWKISRIALVDLNILRLALFELGHANDQIPPKTSIDEALDLAKKYSTQESSRFINGILDQALKNL